jgi:hypothetical protein
LAEAQLRTLLMDLDVLSLEPDEVINNECMSGFLTAFILFLHLFFRKSKSSFGVGTDLREVIKPLIKSRYIAVFTDRNGEVRAISIDQFEGHFRGARVNAGVEGEFCRREMFGSVFLTFVTEETEVLLYFLVLALDFAISFGMIGGSEAGLDTKMFVEGTHELGRKLGATIGEDFLRDSVKTEDIPVVKIGSAFGR